MDNPLFAPNPQWAIRNDIFWEQRLATPGRPLDVVDWVAERLALRASCEAGTCAEPKTLHMGTFRPQRPKKMLLRGWRLQGRPGFKLVQDPLAVA